MLLANLLKAKVRFQSAIPVNFQLVKYIYFSFQEVYKNRFIVKDCLCVVFSRGRASCSHSHQLYNVRRLF